jgi:hypothetical protein
MPARPSLIADVSEQIDSALAIAMAKLPDDRFSTADEMYSAFQQAIAGELNDVWTRRAARLVKKYPWGTRNVR